MPIKNTTCVYQLKVKAQCSQKVVWWPHQQRSHGAASKWVISMAPVGPFNKLNVCALLFQRWLRIKGQSAVECTPHKWAHYKAAMLWVYWLYTGKLKCIEMAWYVSVTALVSLWGMASWRALKHRCEKENIPLNTIIYFLFHLDPNEGSILFSRELHI